MTISLTSSHLLVGTDGGLIHVYDIPSHQLLRTISTHKGLIITYLATMLKPPDLIGHINLNLTVGSAADARDTIPIKSVTPFQRMRDMKTREAHEVSILLPSQHTVCGFIPYFNQCCLTYRPTHSGSRRYNIKLSGRRITSRSRILCSAFYGRIRPRR